MNKCGKGNEDELAGERNPKRLASFSLKSWGKRMRNFKTHKTSNKVRFGRGIVIFGGYLREKL
jgi:hypothetical protein